MYLDWDDWYRADNWRSEFDSVVFGGMNFTVGILWPGMRRLNASLRNGSVFTEAQAITTANAPNGFTTAQMESLLRDGRFKYRQRIMSTRFPAFAPPLTIHGVERTDPDVNRIFGRGDRPGWGIQLNFHGILAWSQEPANIGTYPNNAIGQARLDVLAGSVVLHEVLHNHDFTHAAHPGTAYDPTHAYFRTLPEVAEAAYLQAHADVFPSSAPPLGLTGSAAAHQLTCGT